ncbi:hypothetical protein MUG78_17640 [Gordonia alkaliphila]|uniref:hypothetical protein n=1 Tax=Gordonia alkaliphila TaxID=1053547 RepID=UPI001FF50372|nr:hypothetical protein [Gordonia alkaliphila]MCK0441224.1 hypothetical protein [Gordonia alkaliphila]
MTTMVYRAEAEVDSATFLHNVAAAGYAVRDLHQDAEDMLFGLIVEFDTDADLDQLVDIAASVVDGHILWRTLREGTIAADANELGDYVRV